MKLILSPTKTMEMGSPDLPGICLGHPVFQKDADRLIQVLLPLDQTALKTLFKTSDALTLKVSKMIAEFKHAASCPALFAFKGDAFKTLSPKDFTKEQLQFAQDHLKIFSGLYGILSPLDQIRPYRLDFNTPLKPDGIGMTPFWKKRLIPFFESLLAPDEYLINLASNEFASTLSSKRLKQRTLTFQFREEKEGVLKNISVRAKQARGLFARYIIQNAVSDPEHLKQVSIEHYSYAKDLSSAREWFFIR